MYAVLDTCVLISALRSQAGASYGVLRAIRAGRIKLALSVTLAMEYEAVALRPSLVYTFSPEQIQSIIDGLCHLAHHQKIFFTWRPFLPDPDDDMVLELALAAGASYIITSNWRDFRGSESLGIKIITPAQALTLL